MMMYIKATLLLGSLGMAAQTAFIRGNEELAILYLILFTAFRELWEIESDRRSRTKSGGKNSKKVARNKKRRNGEITGSRRIETIARRNVVS